MRANNISNNISCHDRRHSFEIYMRDLKCHQFNPVLFPHKKKHTQF